MDPLFRNSMFGFNKRDVSEFILTQSKKNETQLRELQDEVSRLAETLEKTKDDLTKSKSDFAESSDNVKYNYELCADAKTAAGNIADSLSEFSGFLHSAREKAALSDENVKKLAAEKSVSDAVKEKAAKFDTLSQMLCGMVNATQNDVQDNTDATENADSADLPDAFSPVIDSAIEKLSEIEKKLSDFSEILEKFRIVDETDTEE